GLADALDRDLAAGGDDAGQRALGLHVEHADGVTLGAALNRLTARGEIEAGHLVDDGDVLVALHEFGLGDVGDADRRPRAHRPTELHADRAIARGGLAGHFRL